MVQKRGVSMGGGLASARQSRICGEMPTKFSRISRIMQILTILQAGKGISVNDLSGIFGTSRRTIFRDLKELQAIGVPYRYDAKSGGYSLGPEFFLPPVDLNLQEALSLLLLVHRTGRKIQLPFKNSALLAALKIENNLPVRIRRYCNIALQNISAKTDAQAPMNLLDITFARLQKAIMRKRKVANNVSEVQWHSTQKVVRSEDGSATIEFRVDGLGDIIWWILGYGDQVQVVSPKILRKKVIETAKNLVRLNTKI